MITVTFSCGHSKQANGSEEKLTCACGETRIAQVDAPVPVFRGHVRGPHAQFEALEPKKVEFNGQQ